MARAIDESGPALKDYWTFPPVIGSFKSTGYGTVKCIDGMDWRVRGGDYVLLTPPKPTLTIPIGANPKRIRSLMWSSKALGAVPKKSAGLTFNALSSWVAPPSLRTLMRRGERETIVIANPGREQLVGILDDWIRQKKAHNPTSMVVRGHYAAMIDYPGFEFMGYNVGGEMVGAFGFVPGGPSSPAAICFAKHRYGSWWLAKYLWVKTIRHLIDRGATGVVCGDTAGKLKREIGLSSERIYRVDFSKLR